MSFYYQHPDPSFNRPTMNYTTAYDQRTSNLFTQWTAVYTLLLLWALTQLLKYAMTAVKHTFPDFMMHGRRRRAYAPIGSAAEEGGTISKYGATGTATTAEGLQRGGAGLGRAGGASTSATGEEEIETALAGGGSSVSARVGGPREEEQEVLEPYGAWTTRLDRAADALRTNLLLLLAASTLMCLPIEYTCTTLYRHIDSEYTGMELYCGPCIANATSTFTTILTWLFVAATIAWALLELLITNPQSSSATRFAIILVSQPLMVVIFVLAFARWSYLKGLMCPSNPSSGGSISSHEEPNMDMYDLLVHGVNLL